ncbi:unnamed protein product [Nippostrongylus brasiliensis]|uniref:tRNA-synt_1 domain-containing protein n=1 Tax=Nippostrongylus brasiliensis TaxID=27835 RepID=A0A0N4XCI4_NIPBR|nr:unnamed protein product [Nippostrongylus brasiliensis]
MEMSAEIPPRKHKSACIRAKIIPTVDDTPTPHAVTICAGHDLDFEYVVEYSLHYAKMKKLVSKCAFAHR